MAISAVPANCTFSLTKPVIPVTLYISLTGDDSYIFQIPHFPHVSVLLLLPFFLTLPINC